MLWPKYIKTELKTKRYYIKLMWHLVFDISILLNFNVTLLNFDDILLYFDDISPNFDDTLLNFDDILLNFDDALLNFDDTLLYLIILKCHFALKHSRHVSKTCLFYSSSVIIAVYFFGDIFITKILIYYPQYK